MLDILTFTILVLLSALFAASETALFSLRESQVRLMAKRGEWNAGLILRLKNDPQRLLTTLLLGNTVVNIAIGSLAAIRAIQYADSVSVGLATGIATVTVLLFGEIFPKSYAIIHKRPVAQVVAYPIFVFYFIFYPITSIFVLIEKFVRRATNAPPKSVVTEDEIRIMSDIGLEHGQIDRHERQMIENVFNFDDTPVGNIMTPKKSIDALAGNVPVNQIAHYVSQAGFSRFPIYEGSQSNYIGYVHTNDVMRVLNSDEREEGLSQFATELHRVDEKTPILSVFRQMTRSRSHLYLVHKGSDTQNIVGLVSMEDILEELVGEIEDEGDRRELLGERG
ncbi:MAG: hypothetical protein UY04_C0018G0014 [Parcubacteria group bacterium GW2011_GWA2_47_7]|nr:MAG: hypothetical protein UY04_C0018G0014 [Parcubacteria group bacterium GW2011_GWA2_47_7]